jgi:hypothetical protein
MEGSPLGIGALLFDRVVAVWFFPGEPGIYPGHLPPMVFFFRAIEPHRWFVAILGAAGDVKGF